MKELIVSIRNTHALLLAVALASLFLGVARFDARRYEAAYALLRHVEAADFPSYDQIVVETRIRYLDDLRTRVESIAAELQIKLGEVSLNRMLIGDLTGLPEADVEQLKVVSKILRDRGGVVAPSISDGQLRLVFMVLKRQAGTGAASPGGWIDLSDLECSYAIAPRAPRGTVTCIARLRGHDNHLTAEVESAPAVTLLKLFQWLANRKAGLWVITDLLGSVGNIASEAYSGLAEVEGKSVTLAAEYLRLRTDPARGNVTVLGVGVDPAGATVVLILANIIGVLYVSAQMRQLLLMAQQTAEAVPRHLWIGLFNGFASLCLTYASVVVLPIVGNALAVLEGWHEERRILIPELVLSAGLWAAAARSAYWIGRVRVQAGTSKVGMVRRLRSRAVGLLLGRSGAIGLLVAACACGVAAVHWMGVAIPLFIARYDIEEARYDSVYALVCLVTGLGVGRLGFRRLRGR